MADLSYDFANNFEQRMFVFYYDEEQKEDYKILSHVTLTSMSSRLPAKT